MPQNHDKCFKMLFISGHCSISIFHFLIILLTAFGVTAGSGFQTDAASRATFEDGNLMDESFNGQRQLSYKEVGCFKDSQTRAVPLLEGSDPYLTGFYKSRQNAIEKCASVARKRGYQVFAIQNGGMCLSGPNAHNTYKMHGPKKDCNNGKGGPWSSDVYIFNDFPVKVYVFTGQLPFAGTDANVYISFSGSLGSTQRTVFAANGHNLFEAGQKDVFNIHTRPFGSLKRITIGHDNAGGSSAGWYLEKVIVKDPRNTVYKFKANRWFAKTEDDGQIEREISATETITPGLYKSLGCFKERSDAKRERAVPSLEGQDNMLDARHGQTPYKDRELSIEKCADVSRRRGYVMFAIQDGGLCASSKEIQNTYDKYGRSEQCTRDGTGSIYSSNIYAFADRDANSQRVLLRDPSEQSATTSLLSQTSGTMDSQTQVSSPGSRVANEVKDTSHVTGTQDQPTLNSMTENSTLPATTAETKLVQDAKNDANFEERILDLAEEYRKIRKAELRLKQNVGKIINGNVENVNGRNENAGNGNPGNENAGNLNIPKTYPGNVDHQKVNTGSVKPSGGSQVSEGNKLSTPEIWEGSNVTKKDTAPIQKRKLSKNIFDKQNHVLKARVKKR